MTDLDLVYAEVDVSELPLVSVLAVGPLTDGGFSDYLASLLAALQLRERVVIRLHGGSLGAFPPRYVRKSVQWMKLHEATLNRHVAAVSVVAESAAIRIATHAMLWAARPPFPMVAKPSIETADAWLLAQLEDDKG